MGQRIGRQVQEMQQQQRKILPMGRIMHFRQPWCSLPVVFCPLAFPTTQGKDR